MRKVVIIFFLFCLLSACSEDVLLNTNDTKKITNEFFLIPKENSSLAGRKPLDSLFIQPAETLFIRAVAKAQEEIIPANELGKHFFVRYWAYKGFMLNEESIRVLWNEPGRDTLCHYSIDLLGDTLKTCLPVFINSTPSIQLLSPENAFNTINPTDSILFQWKISGQDSWETSECEIYLNQNKKDLWLTKPKQIACNKPFKIAANDLNNSSDYPLYFWGIKFKTFSQENSENVFSEINSFRFTLPDSSAAFVVPIRYEASRNYAKNGELYVLLKDSIVNKYTFHSDTSIFISNLNNNKNYKFIVQETLRTDYEKDSTLAFLEKNLITITDTLILKDNTPPEAMPLKESFSKNDSIRFLALENGSGFNALHSAIILENSKDTIPYKFKNNQFAFTLDCETSCKIAIHLEDNAKNKSPKKFWKLQFTEKNIFVLGPYFAGDLE